MYLIFVAIIMGIVEGLTEFIPVSSTGHLILTGELLGFVGEKANNFTIIIQLGAILAIVVIYWKKLFSMITPKNILDFKANRLNVWHIAAAIVPIGIIGLLVEDYIDKYLFSPMIVVIGLIVGSFLMMFAEKMNKSPKIKSIDDITYTQAFFIGLFQTFALWPGFSRSGSTISGAMLFGLDRKSAADFSFIIAIPVMVGAAGIKFVKMIDILTMNDFLILGTGFVVAFIAAYAAVVTFLKLLNKYSLNVFAFYRFALAAVALIYFW